MGFKLWQGGLLMQQKGWEKDLIHEGGLDPGHHDPRAPQHRAGGSRDGLSHHIHEEKIPEKHKGGHQEPPE